MVTTETKPEVQAHFVTFMSPGTFVHEETTKPIDSWDVEKAKEMARGIKERHGATPFGFKFSTKARSASDLDSKVVAKSGNYYLGGVIETIDDIRRRNDPKDAILISNMRSNKIDRVITNYNSWKITLALESDDVVLEWEDPKTEAA